MFFLKLWSKTYEKTTIQYFLFLNVCVKCKVSRGYPVWHTLPERVNKAIVEWDVRTAHICVGWEKKEDRPEGKKKKKQISKSPQHMETGSEKEEVLTGCPCGVLLSECGAEDRGVCSCGGYMDVCTAYAFHGLTSARVLGWQGLLSKGPVLQGWQTSSGLSVCWLEDDSDLNRIFATQ